MKDTNCYWKYQGMPCGSAPAKCRFCKGPIADCGEKCLAACQRGYPFTDRFPDRFPGIPGEGMGPSLRSGCES